MLTLLRNIGQLATFEGNTAKHGKEMSKVKLINNCCVILKDGKIADILPDNALLPDGEEIDCEGCLVTAGFVDCHTHLVFDGERAKEFNMRLAGASYMEIMQAGGGIVKTVEATRNADQNRLLQLAQKRIQNFLGFGVTTVEAKSGYGLDLVAELKQIEVADKLNTLTPAEIVPTFMGAHATPKETTTEKYIEFLIDTVLPSVKKQNKAEFCDCFCEKNVFDAIQSKRILSAAKKMGFGLKLHADEINSIGGTRLAVELGAVSVDHLLKINDSDIDLLANSDTIGVVLPATAFSLKEEYAPARKMIDKGCAIAVASDFNPGSCNTQSIPLIMALSNIYCGLSMAETLCALTLNAAAALKRADRLGTVEKGKQADLVVHNVKDLEGLCYFFAANTVEKVIKKGNVVFEARK